MWRNKHVNKILSVGVALILVLLPVISYADSSSSSHYKVDQTFFGSGGVLKGCSSGPNQYCSKQTLGELAVGNTASDNYQAYAGFNTTSDPYIEFVVTASNIDLGYLQPDSVRATNGQFYIRAWQSQGYVVRTESDPPSNGAGHQITPLASPTASTPGTEQFGINLIKNPDFCGTGCDLGADPAHAQTYSYGNAAPGYDTAGLFKYHKGDIVASSDQSTSVTTYTISYIFNISESTPSGQYTFNHNLVATGTY